jgi:hypothetical protein
MQRFGSQLGFTSSHLTFSTKAQYGVVDPISYGKKDGVKPILRRAYFQAHTFSFLQISDDLKKVASWRIAFRAEHPHEAL